MLILRIQATEDLRVLTSSNLLYNSVAVNGIPFNLKCFHLGVRRRFLINIYICVLSWQVNTLFLLLCLRLDSLFLFVFLQIGSEVMDTLLGVEPKHTTIVGIVSSKSIVTLDTHH